MVDAKTEARDAMGRVREGEGRSYTGGVGGHVEAIRKLE